MLHPNCRTPALVAFVFMFTLLWAGDPMVAQQAADDNPNTGFQVASGRVTFRVYCASCHGVDAKGGGNVAQYLDVKPADLTEIVVRHDGEFPDTLVKAVIDGREPKRGHGSRDMPVWGDVFQNPISESARRPGESGEDRAARKILELVRYLESIQTDRPASREPAH